MEQIYIHFVNKKTFGLLFLNKFTFYIFYMDKSLILNNLKKYYNFKKEQDFAEFLGIKPQLLSSWHQRNSFDIELIYTKCKEINPHYLLTGTGSMLCTNNKPDNFNEISGRIKDLKVVETDINIKLMQENNRLLNLNNEYVTNELQKKEKEIADLQEKLAICESEKKPNNVNS